MTKEITAEEATQAFATLVNQVGSGYQHARECQYVLTDRVLVDPEDEEGYPHVEAVPVKPLCAVGRVLHDSFGVSLEVLQQMDVGRGQMSTVIDSRGTLSILRQEGITFTPEALGMFRTFQRLQDQKVEYGVCYGEMDYAKPIEPAYM